MAMVKLSVLAVCVILALSTCTAQDASCIPTEIPASVLDCSTFTSVYLSCACNVYKTSILEIMSSFSCLIPGSSSSSTIQGQVSQILEEVASDTTGILKTIMSGQVAPNTLEAPAPAQLSLLGSNFTLEQVSLIMNITDKIGENVFDKLCANVAALSQCVNSNFMSSTNPDDMTLKALLKLDHMGTFLTRMCAMKSELYGNGKCLRDSILPLGVCVGLPISMASDNGFSLPLFSGAMITAAQINSLCPIAGDIVQCAALQVATCSSNLAALVKTLPSDLLTTTCSDLAIKGTLYPTTSPLLLCELPHVTKFLPAIAMLTDSQNAPTNDQIQSIIGDIINLSCKILPDYFRCVVEEMPSSRNRYDVFIQELIDIKQVTHGSAIANVFCEPERVKDIKSMMSCGITNGTEFESCGTPNRTMVLETFNITNLGHDANKDRQEFCGPIQELVMCMIDNVLVPCNAKVGAFAKEAYFWIMQTNCNGARNGTFQKVIDQQNGGIPVAISNAGIYWLGFLFASVMMYIA